MSKDRTAKDMKSRHVLRSINVLSLLKAITMACVHLFKPDGFLNAMKSIEATKTLSIDFRLFLSRVREVFEAPLRASFHLRRIFVLLISAY